MKSGEIVGLHSEYGIAYGKVLVQGGDQHLAASTMNAVCECIEVYHHHHNIQNSFIVNLSENSGLTRERRQTLPLD